jgi:ABC-2 type transport system ATP-binding protein
MDDCWIMTVSAAISVRGLEMAYGSVRAVQGIDLEVQRGEIFAFLGPNGAGKTTTLEILEGYRRPTAGSVAVLGLDPWNADGAWRGRIGVVLQESEPDPGLTVSEAVALYAGYHARPLGVSETLRLVGLEGERDVLATTLSGGQRRRLDVGLALVGRPEVVFLDEPTTGFDPAARRAAWEMIEGLRATGTTVFLTTHAMDEAAHLADRIAVLAGGRVIAEGTPATIGGRDTAASIVSFVADLPALPARFRDRAKLVGGKVQFESTSPLADLAELASGGVAVSDLEVRPPTLEDVYLSLTRGAVGVS